MIVSHCRVRGLCQGWSLLARGACSLSSRLLSDSKRVSARSCGRADRPCVRRLGLPPKVTDLRPQTDICSSSFAQHRVGPDGSVATILTKDARRWWAGSDRSCGPVEQVGDKGGLAAGIMTVNLSNLSLPHHRH